MPGGSGSTSATIAVLLILTLLWSITIWLNVLRTDATRYIRFMRIE
jgi:hypothetical protein